MHRATPTRKPTPRGDAEKLTSKLRPSIAGAHRMSSILAEMTATLLW